MYKETHSVTNVTSVLSRRGNEYCVSSFSSRSEAKKLSLILYLLPTQCGSQQTIAGCISVLIGCPAATAAAYQQPYHPVAQDWLPTEAKQG